MRATPKLASHPRHDRATQRALVETRAATDAARAELRALDADIAAAHERARLVRELAPPLPATEAAWTPPLDAVKTLRLSYDFASALRLL